MVIAYLLLIILTTSIYSGDNSFNFTPSIDTENFIPSSLYQEMVHSLPICCIDILLIHPASQSYLVVKRLMPPAQNEWWYPGGRLYKGESFFACAQRKCAEEVTIEIEPIAIIDVYSTVFPDSAWHCQTHTINVAILATCTTQELHCNELHGQAEWRSLDDIPENDYLRDILNKGHHYFFK